MPKRKREDEDDSLQASRANTGRPSKFLRKRAEEKIFHGRKVLQRALKVARGFERQKLGRRQKQATENKDEADKERIQREITALKDLDLPSCAEIHLNKSLIKVKSISASASLPSSVTASTKASIDDNAVANVTARLYNAKAVKDAIKEIIVSIQTALGIDDASIKPLKGQGNEMTGTTSKPTPPNSARDDRTYGPAVLKPHPQKHLEDEDDLGQEGFPDDEKDIRRLSRRVAGSSDEDPFSEDETTIDEEGEASSSSSISGSDAVVLEAKAGRRVQKAPSTSNTSFLPSLTMGGYWSGSEDASDLESGIEAAPRKNRRGQRARQQIWGKKYGKEAKHLANAPASRDDGWDLKRGAQVASSNAMRGGGFRPRWQQNRSAPAARGQDVASGGNASPVMSRNSKAASKPEKAMHPSWEAAKRAKEQSKPAAFTGKKMVFD